MDSMEAVQEHHFSLPRPRLRGRLHQIAFLLTLPAGVTLVTAAQSLVSRIAVALFAASLSGLYAASAALHRVAWRPQVLRWMRSLDYSAIFVLIASTHTAFALLTLRGPWATVSLAGVWTLALFGMTLKLVNVNGFRRLVPSLYLGMGWVAALFLPWIVSALGPVKTGLLFLGGLSYTLGFVVLTRRRPDPWPMVFGYYEVWHAAVVVGSACHFAVIAMLALG